MHKKRRQRGAEMDAPEQERLTPFGRLLEAVIAVRDCDSEDDVEFKRLEARARMAGVAYAKHLGVYAANVAARKAVPKRRQACGDASRTTTPQRARRRSG